MQPEKLAPQIVALFTHVEVELIEPEGESERLSFNIVPDDQADFYIGNLGAGTPLAHALLGQPVGSLCYYESNGIQRARILNITPLAGNPTGVANQRKAAVEQALEQIERTNAIIFSTTIAGKWGDYDTDGMLRGWEEANAGGAETDQESP